MLVPAARLTWGRERKQTSASCIRRRREEAGSEGMGARRPGATHSPGVGGGALGERSEVNEGGSGRLASGDDGEVVAADKGRRRQGGEGERAKKGEVEGGGEEGRGASEHNKDTGLKRGERKESLTEQWSRPR